MDMIFPLLGLAIPILIIVGIVYFVLRIRAGTSIQFSYRGALRIYFYIVILVSVGLAGLGGVSTLIKVGFGEVAGREFSYGDVYKEHLVEALYGEPHDKTEDYPGNNGYKPRSLPEEVEFQMEGSLINGVSLTVIGLFLLLIHLIGIWRLETEHERSDLLRRLYLMAGLVIFAIATIVSLATGIPETLRYALLDINSGEESPGEPLSIAIVALPVWVYYLVTTLRNTRPSSIEEAT
jgi:hypothetical protein